jgi:hypothetical protein
LFKLFLKIASRQCPGSINSKDGVKVVGYPSFSVAAMLLFLLLTGRGGEGEEKGSTTMC